MPTVEQHITADSQPPLRAVRMTLFPVCESLEEARAYAEARIPLEHKNDVFSVLMVYHNTLINQLEKE